MPNERMQEIEEPVIDDPVGDDEELSQPVRYTISSYGAYSAID